jgi:hypothetical protein
MNVRSAANKSEKNDKNGASFPFQEMNVKREMIKR